MTSTQATPSAPEILYNPATDTQRERDPHDYSHISQDRARHCVEYERLNRPRWARYLSNCGRFGTTTAFCKCGRFKEAATMRCHDWTCKDCGRRRSRLILWARTRDIDRIIAEAQIAIELVLPKPHADFDPYTQAGYYDRIVALAEKLFGKMGSTLRAAVIDPNAIDTRLRCLLHGSNPSYSELSARWKRIAGPSAWLRLRPGMDSLDALLWAFAGTEPVLMLTPETRAQIRDAFYNCNLIRTTGKHYRTMTLVEAAEHRAHDCHDNSCPLCKDGTTLDRIPYEERVAEPVEDIEASCEVVRWISGRPLNLAQRHNTEGVPTVLSRSWRERSIHSPPS